MPEPGRSWTSATSPLTENVHQIAIDNVLTGRLSTTQLKDVEDEQQVIDQQQSTTASYLHSMAGIAADVKPAEARAPYLWCANEWVRTSLHNAKTDLATDAHKAMRELGDAIHALEDATSPSHEGFQGWSSNFPIWRKASHVLKERGYPSSSDQTAYRLALEGSVLYAYDIFSGKAAIPDLAFDPVTGKLWMPRPYSPTAGIPPDPAKNPAPTPAACRSICPTLCPSPKA